MPDRWYRLDEITMLAPYDAPNYYFDQKLSTLRRTPQEEPELLRRSLDLLARRKQIYAGDVAAALQVRESLLADLVGALAATASAQGASVPAGRFLSLGRWQLQSSHTRLCELGFVLAPQQSPVGSRTFGNPCFRFQVLPVKIGSNLSPLRATT